MIYAMLYAENGDVVATYDSWQEAERKLAAYVTAHPEMGNEIGLRAYDSGRPAGEFRSAVEILGDGLPQRHLVL
jgi:hypothetical protein